MSKNDLKAADYAALAEFRYHIRRFLHFSEQAARRTGVEPQQHQLMLATRAVGGEQGARIADLAERLQIQHHSAVELISRLEEKDLIQRNRGAADRREVYVSLTPRGERVLRELTLHHREELRSAAPALITALRRVAASSARTGPRRGPKRYAASKEKA